MIKSQIHLIFLLWLCLIFLLFISQSQQQQEEEEEEEEEKIPELEFPCKPPLNNSSYPFCNTSLSIPNRALSLISLLTLPEKIQHLSDNSSAIPRLGIPHYEWWSESLHGIATNGPGVHFNGTIKSATGFPQVILQAASFNRTLWKMVARAVGVEGRAMYNVGQAGLTYWAPNINVFRDPRWGRGQETPGEDPLVVGDYAVEYVKGFQGEEQQDALMLSACCKHFIAYDLEKWRNFTRYTFNAKVSKQDLEETYQPPFRRCIEEGHASCLMCSYNEINGVPGCAQKDLFDMIRNEWGFNGYITADCDAVATIYEYHNYTSSPEDAAAISLKAGMDIDCGTFLLHHAASAVEKGKLSEADIDRALFNLFSVQLRLGRFDGDPRKQRFGAIGPTKVCSKDHRMLALEAAKQGIVLMKNDDSFLPLKPSAQNSIAIIGPAAASADTYGGDYTGFPCDAKSFLDGLLEYAEKVTYASGCEDVSCNSTNGFEEAINIARDAEIVIVVAGLNLSQETEDLDRDSLLLPGKQMDLITAITEVSRKQVILVLLGGGPIDISFAKGNLQIPSILWMGYPGETGGRALAEVVFGQYNPGGKLPMTWYPESFTLVPMNDMNMHPDPSNGYPGRTYKFYTGEVVYGFGHGLSYTSYSYKIILAPRSVGLTSNLRNGVENSYAQGSGTCKALDPYKKADSIHEEELDSCQALTFPMKISITNDGYMDGSHVVMLFTHPPPKSSGGVQKQLIGFERVHVGARSVAQITFTISPCEHLSTVDEQGRRILAFGDHVLTVGEEKHAIQLLSSSKSCYVM